MGAVPAPPYPPSSVKRRVFGLDLIRALAICLVLVSHCGAVYAAWYGKTVPLAIAYCGTFGVEIFFVLSGYLVGRILLQVPPTRIAWRRFMVRRWLRTLPLYYLALAVLFCIWPPSFWQPDHRRVLLRAIPEYALFLQNFAWTMGDNNWFGASWSLAVEEWFYLGFSVAVLAIAARAGRATALCVLIPIFLVIPAIVRGLATPLNSAPHSVVTAVDQICIGVIVAWISLSAPARFRALSWVLPFGLALCTLFWFPQQRWISQSILQAVWTDVLGVGIALCLPAAVMWRDARGLTAGAVRAISLRSYGLYIVHLPVLELSSYYRERVPAPIWCQIAAVSAVILFVPVLTWNYLERPLLLPRLTKDGGSGGDGTSPPAFI